MYLLFLKTHPTVVFVYLAILVAFLIAVVCVVIWLLYKKVPPELTGKNKKDL